MRYTGGRLPLLNPHSMLHAIAAKRKFSPYKLPTPITTKTMLECLSYSMVSPQHCSLTREPASTCSFTCIPESQTTGFQAGAYVHMYLPIRQQPTSRDFGRVSHHCGCIWQKVLSRICHRQP